MEKFNNDSNFLFKNDSNIHDVLNQVYSTRTIEIIVLLFLFFFALIGNFLVIIKLLCYNKNPMFNKKSQKRMSFYLINISIADICVAMFSILPQIIWRYYIFFWSESQIICKFTAFIQVSEKYLIVDFYF